MIDILVTLLLIIGGVFGLIGSFGLWKLRQPMQRLHAPTKASTVGVGAVLLASAVHKWGQGQPSWEELLVLLFLFITAPVSALFLAKVHLHKDHREEDLPRPEDSRWAGYSRDQATGGGK
jgi:multicomponent K+:H+ antiporter subunit G